MVKFSRRTLTETLSWSASATSVLRIPRDRFIQQIHLRLAVTGNTAGSITPHEDAAAALVSAIRLVANGNDSKMYLTMRDLQEINALDYGVSPVTALTTTTSGTGIALGEAVATIDFRAAVKLDNDCAMLLPAHQLSSLDLYVDWGAASALGTGFTVTAATMYVSLKEADMTARDLAATGMMLNCKWSYKQVAGAASTNFTEAIDLPTGSFLRRTLLRMYNNSARANTWLTRYRIEQQSPIRQDILDMATLDSQSLDHLEYGVSPSGGYTMIDFEEFGALDLRKSKEGDVKLKYLAGSPTSATVRLVNQEIY